MIPYSINVIWSEEDEAYLATIPELPGLTAFGNTQLEAVQEATEIAEDMIAIKIKHNDPLPKPLIYQESAISA